MDGSQPIATIGHNAPPPHLGFIQQADDLKTEAKAWLDGSEIKTQAEAEKVALLVEMATKLDKAAETARVEITKPLDVQKAAVMDDFRPVGQTCTLIKDAAKKATTKWLLAEKARKDEIERIERERLEVERIALLAATKTAQSLEDIEAAQQAITEHMGATKALERSEKATVKVSGGGRAMGLRTVWEADVIDAKALVMWFWQNRCADITAWCAAEALKEVRATSGASAIAGVKNRKTQAAA